MKFLLVTRLPSIHFVLTVCSLIKFLKQFWQTLGYYNYHFQKEIRKSMNFKQDSEREIKGRGGGCMASRCDLTRTWRQSQCHPYLSEEIQNEFHVCSIPDCWHYFHFYCALKIFTAVCQRGRVKDTTLRWRSWVVGY